MGQSVAWTGMAILEGNSPGALHTTRPAFTWFSRMGVITDRARGERVGIRGLRISGWLFFLVCCGCRQNVKKFFGPPQHSRLSVVP